VTPLGWLAVGAAATLVPAPGQAALRVDTLTGLGRLDKAETRRHEPVERWARSLARPAVVRLVLSGVIGAVALIGGIPLGVASAAVAGTGWAAVRDSARRKQSTGQRGELLAGLRMLIGELEAGARPPAALAASAEAAPAYAAVFAAAAAAADTGDAGSVLAAEPRTRAIGLAWQLGERAGTELTGVLARVARDLAAEDEQRRSVAIALAGPRASATVLAGLPALGLALGTAMGARPWDFLVSAGAGQVVCCTGVLLDVAGLWWMRRILARAEMS
jgi:tight adherence protein B